MSVLLQVVRSVCAIPKSRYYKERQVDREKRKAIRRWFVSIRHGRHVLSQCPKQRQSPPGNIKKCLLIPGEILLFRALAKNMAPMTNADESPTNRLTFFWLNISLFLVSTLWPYCHDYIVLMCFYRGQILHTLGDELSFELGTCLPIFLERLRNEITRLTTVKAVTLIAGWEFIKFLRFLNHFFNLARLLPLYLHLL